MTTEEIDYDDPSPNKRPWITITVEAEMHSDLAGMGLLWDGKLAEGLPARFTADDILALLKKDGRGSKDQAIIEWDLLGDPRIVVNVQWPTARVGTWEHSTAEWGADAGQ